MLQSEAVKYNPAIHAGEIVFYGKVVYKQGSLIEIQIAVLTLRQRHREIFNSAVTRSVLETDLTFDDRNLNIILPRDRKSTRLNSSHVAISYAVFCLKKKK